MLRHTNEGKKRDHVEYGLNVEVGAGGCDRSLQETKQAGKDTRDKKPPGPLRLVGRAINTSTQKARQR